MRIQSTGHVGHYMTDRLANKVRNHSVAIVHIECQVVAVDVKVTACAAVTSQLHAARC